ncbi:MAG: Hpt domain-containing protein [Pseudomonadota bacterium]|nr:Hpt domain-containing protein [Pseudomonadota bacterium]
MTVQDAAARDEGESCIDHSQIDGLVAAAGVDGALEILAAFWRSTESLLEALRSQLAAAAADEASRTAHALKGSALNVGAVRFSNTVREIEECCRAQDSARALTLIAVAEGAYAETVDAFRRHLGA